jgi:pimeloyl-ACP methyl ester carboxylesterase
VSASTTFSSRKAAVQGLVEANGVRLCVDTFGERSDPAILLVMGSSASMDWWEEEFCERLAAGSRFVVRYDHRDTGRSVSYEPGAPPYTLVDLVGDAVGVLDALDLEAAHLVGMSMGGGIVQLAALDHPERASSLTLISTSPAGPGPDDPDLPGMSEEALARFPVDRPDWSDRAATVEHVVELARASAGSRPFDESSVREVAGRAFDRTANFESTMTNHDVVVGGVARWRERLAELRIPTLVIHGTEDPVLPHPHGVALAAAIPGAKLLSLEGIGHELPAAVWDVVVPAVLAHTEERRP